MKLFKFFKPSKDASLPVPEENKVAQATAEVVSTESNTVATSTPENNADKESNGKDEVISIAYGTGMPIDVIYAYIGKDYEPDGYEDALVNPSVEYCKTKETIILNQLQQLFRQVTLTYKGEIRMLDVHIENSKSLFNLSSAAMLEAKKETCEEHIAEIKQMLEKLRNNSPEMLTMIDSYRRGFSKGVSAKTASFLSSNI